MATESLSALVSKCVMREPFLGAVLAGLRRVVDPPGVDSMATDGKTLYVSQAFLDEKSNEDAVFVLLHEAGHAALMHSWRRQRRNPEVFNYACDAVVNLLLKESGHRPPDDAFMLPWVTLDMDCETVYHKLMEQAEANGGKVPAAGGAGDPKGDVQDAPDDAPHAETAAQLGALARMAKAAGTGSAMIDRVLQETAEPPADWTEILRHLLRESSRDDYTYARFARRLLGRRLYLPSLHSEAMGGLVVAVDTSGSMGPSELGVVASNIEAIVEDCRPSWVWVVYCDSRVAGSEKFDPGDPIELHAKGGGGTSFRPVFEWVEELGEPIAALIYLTDLYGDTSIPEPDYPVIWGVPNTNQGPFGTTVRVA